MNTTQIKSKVTDTHDNTIKSIFPGNKRGNAWIISQVCTFELSDDTGSCVNSPTLFGFGRTDSHLHQRCLIENSIIWYHNQPSAWHESSDIGYWIWPVSWHAGVLIIDRGAGYFEGDPLFSKSLMWGTCFWQVEDEGPFFGTVIGLTRKTPHFNCFGQH